MLTEKEVCLLNTMHYYSGILMCVRRTMLKGITLMCIARLGGQCCQVYDLEVCSKTGWTTLAGMTLMLAQKTKISHYIEVHI